MADFPIELLNKYDLPPLSEYIKTSTDRPEVISGYYKQFLIQTDHIPNKIIESLVENLATATALNFIGVFIQFIKDVKVNYNDILLYRKFAREEINRLEGETEDETEGETEGETA